MVDSTYMLIENIELVGTGGDDSALLWVETDGDPAGKTVLIYDSKFTDARNGILTGYEEDLEVYVVKSEFARCGGFYAYEGQHHNLYIGEIAKFVFANSYSHTAYGGQTLKSRASTNFLLYSKFLDEVDAICTADGDCVNHNIDLPYGRESYVIGSTIQKSDLSDSWSHIQYNGEQRFTAYFKTGGTAELTPSTVVTNSRTSSTFTVDIVYTSVDYGFTGSWAGNDQTGAIVFRSESGNAESYTDDPALHTDLLDGDTITYSGGNLEIQGTDEETTGPIGYNLRWSFGTIAQQPLNGLTVINSTFVNYHAQQFSDTVAIYSYYDTAYANAYNNIYIDLSGDENYPFVLDGGPSGGSRDATDNNPYWSTADPGFTAVGTYDYSLTGPGAAEVGTSSGPRFVNGYFVTPIYHPGVTIVDRTVRSEPYKGAFDYSGSPTVIKSISGVSLGQ
jgi:hypothetical protein